MIIYSTAKKVSIFQQQDHGTWTHEGVIQIRMPETHEYIQ